MRIGELLVAAKLVSTEQVAAALQQQRRDGGRLGENLVAIGAIDAEALEKFSRSVPPVPTSLSHIGIGENELLSLLLKIVQSSSLETVAALTAAIKLPSGLVSELVEMAVRGQLLAGRGQTSSWNGALRYGLTDAGRSRASDASAVSSYAGPAPIPLAVYTYWLSRQKVTNEMVGWDEISGAFSDIQITDSFIDQIGPAVRSGRPVLLYGPAGNGKTSIAQRLGKVFRDIIYIPHAVMIDGQVMRVFDSDVPHAVAASDGKPDSLLTSLYAEDFDERWVACWRPFIVTGGELTLEMLDLRHETQGNFYEAPLHVKASGGCLLIDDFGRQLVSPMALLNRWIVPLENRVDYLKLHTGKSFKLPFEAIVIFSTNLAPADLMDPAFLRRIPYKLEIGAPSPELYREIFEQVVASNVMGGMLTDAIFDGIVNELVHVRGIALAAYQPGFLVEQIVAACRFKNQPLGFHQDFIDYAISNLSVGGMTKASATAS
jgi:hypothetical protein